VTNYCPTAEQTEVRVRPPGLRAWYAKSPRGLPRNLDALSSSYQFHKGLESPASFVRREWQALTIFGGIFVVVVLIGILAVPPAYFYPRMSTDPLLYYLKGLAFAETGNAAARTVINHPPFEYVAMPGVLRAPFMMMFSDFDDQLRAIQLSNILLVTITGAMFAYVLSWALPRSRHWMAIGFTFGFMLLSPNWVANVFEPLADAPYTAFTMGVIILAAGLLTSPRPLRTRPLAFASGAVLLMTAFMVKFTAPILLVYVAVLAAGRRRDHPIPRRVKILGSAGAVAGTALLVFFNWSLIVDRYLPEPAAFLDRASRTGMFLNLTGISLPAQVIPVYHLAFAQNPVRQVMRPEFGTTPGDTALTAIGVGISLVIFYGMWRARRRFMPEIWYFLTALPVITLMIPSTRRYLMAYLPLIWIFFCSGVAGLLRPLRKRVGAHRLSPKVGFTFFVVVALGLVFVRSQRLVGTAGDRRGGISIGRTMGYVNEVATTFADLRRFIESLPRDRTLLIGATGTAGRWTAISGFKYYYPDSRLTMAVRTHEVYVLLECGSLEVCQDFENWDSALMTLVDRRGPFAHKLVFSRITQHAKARVYRLTNLQ
jgi:hypothetical protein